MTEAQALVFVAVLAFSLPFVYESHLCMSIAVAVLLALTFAEVKR